MFFSVVAFLPIKLPCPFAFSFEVTPIGQKTLQRTVYSLCSLFEPFNIFSVTSSYLVCLHCWLTCKLRARVMGFIQKRPIKFNIEKRNFLHQAIPLSYNLLARAQDPFKENGKVNVCPIVSWIDP